MAAIEAAWAGAAVTLFERNASIGRKVMVSGGGRCNLTNDGVTASRYTCADPAWMETLLAGFGKADLLAMLRRIGVPSYHTDDGWYYPLSDSAQTVVDAFGSAMTEAGVTQHINAQVTAIRLEKGGIRLHTILDGVERDDTFERVIVAAGGHAYPNLGTKGELFAELKRLGHTVLTSRPALAPVIVELKELAPLQGLRVDAGVTLWDGKTRVDSTAGNMIFTQFGLNGPAVMDISHQISARPGHDLTLQLDLLKFVRKDFDELLAQKRQSNTPVRVFLGGFFAPKIGALYLRLARLPEGILFSQLDQPGLERLLHRLEDTRLVTTGVREFEYCQISAGGVPATETDPRTLESCKVKGLYLTGETLDVVGPCGGYNIQYAFSSGALAGRAAAIASV